MIFARRRKKRTMINSIRKGWWWPWPEKKNVFVIFFFFSFFPSMESAPSHVIALLCHSHLRLVGLCDPVGGDNLQPGEPLDRTFDFLVPALVRHQVGHRWLYRLRGLTVVGDHIASQELQPRRVADVVEVHGALDEEVWEIGSVGAGVHGRILDRGINGPLNGMLMVSGLEGLLHYALDQALVILVLDGTTTEPVAKARESALLFRRGCPVFVRLVLSVVQQETV